MAAKEEVVASVTLAATVKQGDPIVKPEVQAAVSAVVVPSSAVHSDASSTQPLSPQHQLPPIPSEVLYPKPLATHDAVVADAALFMDTFSKFHGAIKSKPSIPKMGGKDLDVHLLYREVSSRGGLQAVIRDRKWKEITLVFQLPRTTTSASYVLRKYYVSLLYHYEQVYRNGVTGPLIAPSAALSVSSPTPVQGGDSAVSDSADPVVKRRVRKRREPKLQLPAVDPSESIGSTVVGSIEGKLDFGYLVSMVVGGETLKGILYHAPPGSKSPQYASVTGHFNAKSERPPPGVEVHTRRKRRKKEEMPKKDPNAPRPNRTGYNFFFAEQRQRLKTSHPDKDKEVSRMIGEAWSALTEQEKTPYQERGVKDKERFKREFCDYLEKLKTGYYDNPANGQGPSVGAVSSEDPNNGDHSNAGALDTEQSVGAPASLLTQAAGATVVSEQLQSAPIPVPLVPTQ